MTAQLDMFSRRKPARNSDPATSHDAAEKLNTPYLEGVVRSALLEHGPMTTNELSEYLDIALVTVSPRLRPLAGKGLVVDTGERREGKSRRKSIVWRAITEEAKS